MKSPKLASIVAFTAGLLGFAPYAAAQQTDSGGSSSDMVKTDWSKDFAFYLGTKLWINEWTTWSNPTPEIVRSNTSNWEVVPIPVASVRWKDLFVSGSYFADTTYEFPNLVDGEREEFDVAMGYYVIPGKLALIAGYKYINQKFGLADYDFDGPTVGFVGAVPMDYGFSLYTNFAYGFLQVDSKTFAVSGPNFALDDDRESRYWLVDTGIAWTYNVKEAAPHLLLSQATVTLGYRHQQVETVGVAAPFNGDDDGIDATRGMAVGVQFAF